MEYDAVHERFLAIESDLDELFAAPTTQVGGYSTALYEGLVSSCSGGDRVGVTRHGRASHVSNRCQSSWRAAPTGGE